MTITREFVSPDGSLRLIVDEADDGDIAIGFDAYPWHTHGDILAEMSGVKNIAEAIERFIADIIEGRLTIVFQKRSGLVIDAWPTDDPAAALLGYQRYGFADETMEFRVWDGTSVKM